MNFLNLLDEELESFRPVLLAGDLNVDLRRNNLMTNRLLTVLEFS